jgi:2-oxoglutarate dehydrogenase E1 component
MLMVPIFHVHGENPEALLHVMCLAADYRWEFRKDVVIDLICYRRYGHNEGDEPYFTQPHMYDRIRERPPLHQLYMDKLLDEDVVKKNEIDTVTETINVRLETAYETIHGSGCPFPEIRFYENWHHYHGNYSHELVKTDVAPEKLISLARKLNSVPTGFSLHPKLKRLLRERLESVEGGAGIDWANAETLAFASLLTEGTPIRLSGQDSGRGTFSQRHSVLIDTTTEKHLIPLNELEKTQAPFVVYDSMLSEAGVLAFEYGYSLAQPDCLVIWEAQFGDFANNAQAIIDLYIISGESKWQRLSGVVLLLPHGFEGLGPEHSSARLERFLQLTADDNIQVCNPTTPAQYFHLLRRQSKSTYRKPLIIMTPKSLLRHPSAVSKREELSKGSFRAVLDDPNHPEVPGTVLLCSGKIFYELLQRRNALQKTDVAILRIEQLYPFPEFQLQKVISNYRQTKSWYWVQEEPENMGAWKFVKPQIEVLTERPIAYIGRKAASSPATGFPRIYRKEQDAIIQQAVGPSPE